MAKAKAGLRIWSFSKNSVERKNPQAYICPKETHVKWQGLCRHFNQSGAAIHLIVHRTNTVHKKSYQPHRFLQPWFERPF